MSSTPPSMTAAVQQRIEDTEKHAADQIKSLSKLKARLGKAKRELAAKPKPLALLAKLIADLRTLSTATPSGHGGPELGRLIEELDRHQEALRVQMGNAFIQELRARSDGEGVEFRKLADAVGLGPFDLHVVAEKEVAVLKYARQVIEKDLAIDAGRILNRVKLLTGELLAPPKDLNVLASELREAMRVAVARHGQSINAPELRAELPSVYREMIYVRQGKAKPATKGSFKDYPLPRFIVEVKSLLQSDENLRSDRRMKLEPAVIENAKDPRKSIFIPNDLAHGYGEGSYYQAIVLMPPA